MWREPASSCEPHRRVMLADARPELVDHVHALFVDLVDERGSAPTPIELIRLETAAVEVLANIVEHAARIDPPDAEVRQVHIEVLATPGSLEAHFRDDGRPAEIDLGAVTMPGADAESGRGLAMALAAVDDLTYERVDGINRWSLMCRRS